MSKLFETYSALMDSLPDRSDDAPPMRELKLWENSKKHLDCYYAPFDHVNQSAKIIIVGITPGRTQMNRALASASQSIKTKTSIDEAMVEVKRKGSLSGKMRQNIVNTLNKLGYRNKLGIGCASELWSSKNHLIHFCSLLKYPVFINGKDYNGNPNPLKVTELRSLLIDGFARDLKSISPDAEIVPLGDFVASVVSELDHMNLVPQKIFRFEGKVVAPPHPSGANAEAISLLLSDQYPAKEAYIEQMYREYMSKRSWEKRNKGKPQAEEKYKEARASRWESMLFVRRAYGLNA